MKACYVLPRLRLWLQLASIERNCLQPLKRRNSYVAQRMLPRRTYKKIVYSKIGEMLILGEQSLLKTTEEDEEKHWR